MHSPCSCVLCPQHVALIAHGRKVDTTPRPSTLAMPPQKMETADVFDKKSSGADTVTRLQARYVEFQRGLSVAVDRMAASTLVLVRPSSIHNLLNVCAQISTRKLSCNLRLQLNFRAI